jgi:hypothetical protein
MYILYYTYVRNKRKLYFASTELLLEVYAEL